jgi:UDP-3-O-[3-hydroxymyristoyl] glucosamine N-acyltransferase
MVDARFFPAAGPFTLGQLAEVADATLADGASPEAIFLGVGPMQAAGPDQVTFLDNPKYKTLIADSAAGGCVIHPDMALLAPSGMALLLSKDPYRSYGKIAAVFHPSRPLTPGIADNAVIDASAQIGADCEIGPGAVIEAGVTIGPRTWIGALSVVCRNSVIGADCRIDNQVTLSHCLIGDRVSIGPGTRVGQPGFGFAPSAQGHLTIPQLGRVIIEDDSDIGANNTIDRGAGPDTVIGQGCRIDNLVQIGHNVVLGRGCVVAAQVGFAGSSQIGDFAMFGGQAGVAGHLSIGAGAKIAGKAGVMRDLDAGATVVGMPAIPNRSFFRQQAELARLVTRKSSKSDG